MRNDKKIRQGERPLPKMLPKNGRNNGNNSGCGLKNTVRFSPKSGKNVTATKTAAKKYPKKEGTNRGG